MGAVDNHDGVLRDRVEIIEYNEFYDDQSKLVFCQYIFWDKDDTIIDWRLAKNGNEIRYDYTRRCNVLRIIDGESLREITAPTKSWTLTQHDPELHNREKLSVDKRKKLCSKPIDIKSVLRNK